MGSLSSSSSGSSSGKGLCYRVSGILVGTLDEFYKYEDKVKQSGDTRVKVYVYETEMNGFGLVNLIVYNIKTILILSRLKNSNSRAITDCLWFFA